MALRTALTVVGAVAAGWAIADSLRRSGEAAEMNYTAAQFAILTFHFLEDIQEEGEKTNRMARHAHKKLHETREEALLRLQWAARVINECRNPQKVGVPAKFVPAPIKGLPELSKSILLNLDEWERKAQQEKYLVLVPLSGFFVGPKAKLRLAIARRDYEEAHVIHANAKESIALAKNYQREANLERDELLKLVKVVESAVSDYLGVKRVAGADASNYSSEQVTVFHAAYEAARQLSVTLGVEFSLNDTAVDGVVAENHVEHPLSGGANRAS